MGGRRNCGKEPMARDDLAEGQRLRGGQATCAAGSARSDSELVVPKKYAAAYPVAAFGSVKRVVHVWLDRQGLGTALTAAKCCFFPAAKRARAQTTSRDDPGPAPSPLK